MHGSSHICLFSFCCCVSGAFQALPCRCFAWTATASLVPPVAIALRPLAAAQRKLHCRRCNTKDWKLQPLVESCLGARSADCFLFPYHAPCMSANTFIFFGRIESHLSTANKATTHIGSQHISIFHHIIYSKHPSQTVFQVATHKTPKDLFQIMHYRASESEKVALQGQDSHIHTLGCWLDALSLREPWTPAQEQSK